MVSSKEYSFIHSLDMSCKTDSVPSPTYYYAHSMMLQHELVILP